MAIFSHRRSYIIDSPRGMTCFFYCVLLLIFFYMLVGRLRSVADPYVQMPTSSVTCIRGIDLQIIISLDARNRAFLQVDGELQTSLIRQVAKQHGLFFTAAQLRELSKMPYLSQSIEQLPKWLTAYEKERRSLPLGIPTDEELSEYIEAGLQVSRKLYDRPPYFALRADKSLSAPQIQHIIKLFQQHGINRINLITEQE
jgi:biopolymer transport protein ExbD